MLPLHDNVPTRTFPLVTVGLIVTNFVVWLWELSGGRFDQHVADYSYYPCSVTDSCLRGAGHLPYWEGAFTSLFMHASWAHIIGNMLFLWIFGNNVEDAMGHLRFLVFYLSAGLAATALQTYITCTSRATQVRASRTSAPAGRSLASSGLTSSCSRGPRC